MLCPTKRVWTLLIFSLVLIIHCLSLHSLLCLLVTNWFKTWRFIIEVNILGTLLCPVFSRKSCQLYRHCLKTCTPLASSMVLGDKIIAKFIKAQWRKKKSINGKLYWDELLFQEENVCTSCRVKTALIDPDLEGNGHFLCVSGKYYKLVK